MRRGIVVVAAIAMTGLLIGGAVIWQSQARAKVAEPADLGPPWINEI